MSKLSLFFSRTSSVRLLFSSLFLLVFLSFYILTMCRLFNAEFLKSAFSRTIYWVCWVIEIDRRRFIQQFVDIITQFLGYFLTNFFSKVQMGRMKTDTSVKLAPGVREKLGTPNFFHFKNCYSM